MESSVMEEPVIIIRYFTWLRLFPRDRQVSYELCKRDGRARDGWKVISQLGHLEAMELIEANQLEQVVRNKYGTIWEGMMDLKARKKKHQYEEVDESVTIDSVSIDADLSMLELEDSFIIQ